jgi:hypothetical protein
MAYTTNLLEFISKEENNLLTSMVKCHDDVAQFAKVDGHFQAIVKHLDVPADDEHGRTMLALYLFTHYHLYLSFVTLMRCHLSDSLASTRKAIDATLSAYRLCVEPQTLEQYLNAEGAYLRITRTMERARSADANAYPLAPPLLHLHGVCSQFGSHADVSSFVHRIKVVPVSSDKATIEHLLFQYPEDPAEFRYYFASTLSAYMLMLEVFIEPVGKYAAEFDLDSWRKSSNALVMSIEKVRAALAEAGLEKKATEG